MAFRAYKKLAQKDFSTGKMQDNTEQFNNQFRSNPLLDGRRITDLSFSGTALRIEHKLGRQPLGYLITRQNANVNIWFTQLNELFLTLDASGAVNFEIWVF